MYATIINYQRKNSRKSAVFLFDFANVTANVTANVCTYFKYHKISLKIHILFSSQYFYLDLKKYSLLYEYCKNYILCTAELLSQLKI